MPLEIFTILMGIRIEEEATLRHDPTPARKTLSRPDVRRPKHRESCGRALPYLIEMRLTDPVPQRDRSERYVASIIRRPRSS